LGHKLTYYLLVLEEAEALGKAEVKTVELQQLY
jgi:hypothetical protein